MKPRNVVLSVLGVAAVAALAAFAVIPSRAGAVPSGSPNPATPAVFDVLYDIQDVTTSPSGTHRLDYADGKRHAGECLEQPADPAQRQFVTVVVPARNLTNPGNAPIGVQAVQHDQCGVLLAFFNKDNEPIGNADLRVTYHASSVLADQTP